jgi:hypothetical protein
MPEQPTFLASAQDPRLADSYRYWLGKKELLAPGCLPGRQHLRPAEMLGFLPYIVMFDVERDAGGLRFRYRLTGSNFFHLFGQEVTGLYIEEVGSAEMAAAAAARFSNIVETQQPCYGVSPVPVISRDFLHYEHVTMPLARDGTTVDMLFGTRFAIGRRHCGEKK